MALVRMDHPEFYADLRKMSLDALTTEPGPEERLSPHVWLFDLGPAEPAPEVLEAIRPGRAMDPK